MKTEAWRNQRDDAEIELDDSGCNDLRGAEINDIQAGQGGKPIPWEPPDDDGCRIRRNSEADRPVYPDKRYQRGIPPPER